MIIDSPQEMDYFYDVRIYKDEIQSVIGIDLSDEEFDKIMESFDIFHLRDLIVEYIKNNKEVIIELITNERQMELPL
jgi:hypothetical protein